MNAVEAKKHYNSSLSCEKIDFKSTVNSPCFGEYKKCKKKDLKNLHLQTLRAFLQKTLGVYKQPDAVMLFSTYLYEHVALLFTQLEVSTEGQ